MTDAAPHASGVDVAAVSDVGTTRAENEDACGHLHAAATSVLVAVADGVSGCRGAATASRMAIDVLFRAYQEQGAGVPASKRLYRAVQQANIEVYDLATVVPELRGMSTTLTAILVEEGRLLAAHIGDSRLYRVRQGEITQLTKDHTVVGERVRGGLMSASRARAHPERSTLTRSLGRELIVAVDRITTELAQDDVLVLCSDGLYTVLDDAEMAQLVRAADAASASRSLIAAANERGTPDNVTAAVVRMTGAGAQPAEGPGLFGRLRRIFGGTAFA